MVADRQAELDDLVERLAAFNPQHAGVERVWGRETARTDSLYAAHLASGGQSDDRDESVQVGFRLARRVGLDAVVPLGVASAVDSDAPGGSLNAEAG